MKDNKVLILDDVSVRYRKRDSRATADIFRRLMGKEKRNNEFWALKNVSFSLEKGDMLGVIGKNGAGKSTMMKAISGTLCPASGTIEKEGKLCALLELGAGFDQDMTVKENVYLRGALLGYSKEFIDGKYDEIIDFADMREFEDSPFRTLSSGMKSRIAFSIASMVEPDMIILDEIFAVGDGDFRKKSQKTMQNIIANGDTTALMVSHSMQTVRDQCNKVLWLDRGRMVMFGDPKTVCDAYAEYLNTGKLPETESLKATEKNPINKMAKTKGKIFGEVMIYLLLLMFTLGGIFFWSQYDLFRAYFIAKDSTPEQIMQVVDDYRDEANELLEADISGWNTEVLDNCTEDIRNEKATIKEVAKEVVGDSFEPGSREYRRSLAAAELAVTKRYYSDRCEKMLADIKAEHDALPEDSRPNLLVYTYGDRQKFFNLEKKCDDAVQDVIEEVRSQLKKEHYPEEYADKIFNAYKSEKGYMIAYYMENLK